MFFIHSTNTKVHGVSCVVSFDFKQHLVYAMQQQEISLYRTANGKKWQTASLFLKPFGPQMTQRNISTSFA